MEDNLNKEESLNILLNKYNIDKNKVISPLNINYYNPDDVIENTNLYDLTCPCCLNILKNPISFSSNTNCHSFCKECIDKYLFEKQNCPICKNKFEYFKNEKIEKSLNNLYFKCFYQKEGCDKILKYIDYLNHINECYFTKYICKVDKFNYLKKDFEKCNFIGNNEEIEGHFKLCEFYSYKCKFCNENIFNINLKSHIENKCKIRILKYSNGDKYEGEFKNGIREGYGIYYYSNGDKFEGEFKNEIREGFGVFYFSDGILYEGEFKNGIIEGYGIYYYSNGDIYKGEFKHGIREGYGIYYYSKGDKYEGEFKGGIKEGYGIYYYSNKYKYKGEFKYDKFEGYGILYSLDGSKYEGQFKNGLKEGYGKIYYSEGDKYEGEFKDDVKEGYGIFYYSNGCKYEGEFKNEAFEGYGIYYNSNGNKFEGEFKNDLFEGYGIFYFSNGDEYEGELKNDLFEGYGIYNFKIFNSEFKGNWKKGYPAFGYLNLFNISNYFLSKALIEKYFILIKAVPILLKYLEILSKLNLRTYLLIFILIVSVILI